MLRNTFLVIPLFFIYYPIHFAAVKMEVIQLMPINKPPFMESAAVVIMAATPVVNLIP